MAFEPAILVLLGASGAGKDTAAAYLQGQNPYLVNVKFSDPIKKALASYLDVDRALMDDRVWRETPIEELGCTPLDILVRSFEYMPQIHPQLGLIATGKTCRALLGDGKQIVFTDMRNVVEKDFVIRLAADFAVPLYVYCIHRFDVVPRASDRHIPGLYYAMRPFHVQGVGRITNDGSIPELHTALTLAFDGTPFKSHKFASL